VVFSCIDDMHDEGKRLLLARDGEDSSNKKMKLEDVVSPIIRCKGILVDTKHQRIALQGLYEQHELFDLPSRKEKSNQIVFIGAIPEVLQSKIRVEVTSCFTNAEVCGVCDFLLCAVNNDDGFILLLT